MRNCINIGETLEVLKLSRVLCNFAYTFAYILRRLSIRKSLQHFKKIHGEPKIRHEMPTIIKIHPCKLGKNHFIVVIHLCKPLKNNIFLFTMNSTTDSDVDGRDSYEIGGDKKVIIHQITFQTVHQDAKQVMKLEEGGWQKKEKM